MSAGTQGGQGSQDQDQQGEEGKVRYPFPEWETKKVHDFFSAEIEGRKCATSRPAGSTTTAHPRTYKTRSKSIIKCMD